MYKPMYKVSVIMPALNEEAALGKAIETTLASFKKFNISGQLVIVNDGSSDKTKQIAEAARTEHLDTIVVINHASPEGVGRSFWDGVKNAQGEAVLLLPGDNENDPDEIIRYAPLIDSVDLVVPYVINKEVRAFSRNLISGLFTFIINATFGTDFKYTNGTIIYRRALLKDLVLRSNGFFFQAEALIKLNRRGYLFAEVPCFLAQRVGGNSKAISFRSLKNVVNSYFELIKDVYLTGEYRFDLKTISTESARIKRIN